jgi:DNA-binding cell septation regulator SpoVG
MENIVSDVRMWPVKNSKKAVASGFVVFGGKVKVKCAIIKSQKDDGLFVVLPYHEDGEGNIFNDVEGTNAENTKAFKDYIIAQYLKGKEEANQFDQTADAAAEGTEEKPWG